jgi:hypothetical protein
MKLFYDGHYQVNAQTIDNDGKGSVVSTLFKFERIDIAKLAGDKEGMSLFDRLSVVWFYVERALPIVLLLGFLLFVLLVGLTIFLIIRHNKKKKMAKVATPVATPQTESTEKPAQKTVNDIIKTKSEKPKNQN